MTPVCRTVARLKYNADIWSLAQRQCLIFSSVFFLLEVSGLSLPPPPFFKEEGRKRRKLSWLALGETAHFVHTDWAPTTGSPAMLNLLQGFFNFQRAETTKPVSILVCEMSRELRRGEGGDLIITITY